MRTPEYLTCFKCGNPAKISSITDKNVRYSCYHCKRNDFYKDSIDPIKARKDFPELYTPSKPYIPKKPKPIPKDWTIEDMFALDEGEGIY